MSNSSTFNVISSYAQAPDVLIDPIFTVNHAQANLDPQTNHQHPYLYYITIEDNAEGYRFQSSIVLFSRHIMKPGRTYSLRILIEHTYPATQRLGSDMIIYRDFVHDFAPKLSEKAPDAFKGIKATIKDRGVNYGGAPFDKYTYIHVASLHRGTDKTPFRQDEIRLYSSYPLDKGRTYLFKDISLLEVSEYKTRQEEIVRLIKYADKSEETAPDLVDSPETIAATRNLPPVTYKNVWVMYTSDTAISGGGLDGHITILVESAEAAKPDQPDIEGRLVTVPVSSLPQGWDRSVNNIPVAPNMPSQAVDSIIRTLAIIDRDEIGTGSFRRTLMGILGADFCNEKKDTIARMRDLPGMLGEDIILPRLRKLGRLDEERFPIMRLYVPSLTVGFAENGRIYARQAGPSATTPAAEPVDVTAITHQIAGVSRKSDPKPRR